jgi:hypothetical protein
VPVTEYGLRDGVDNTGELAIRIMANIPLRRMRILASLCLRDLKVYQICCQGAKHVKT